ncbi:MAG: alpha/beta hydrolase [Candidatus Limnocylindria bacterium]
MIRRVESQLATPSGRSLFRRSWSPARPEQVLLLIHGFAEHSGRYEHFGAWFAARGCAVHAFDHQGHGRSDGVRAHVRRFDDFLDDLDAMLGAVRAEHPGLRPQLVGHSMGGLILAAFLCERAPDVAGAVSSGAALAVSENLSRGRILAARVLRRVAPRLAFDAGLDPEGLSRDPEVVRAYLEDPLVFRKMTTSLAAELIRAIERTSQSAARVRVPILMLHGEQDPICPASGTRRFFEGLTVEPRQLQIYPGLRHEIFNEPEHVRVFEDVLAWVRARTR